MSDNDRSTESKEILRNQVRWLDTDNNLVSYHSRSLVQEARIVSPNRLIILGFLNHKGVL